MHEEHGENNENPEMTQKLGLEQLAQELQESLSAGSLPTRTSSGMMKSSSGMKDDYESMKGPGSTARTTAFRLKWTQSQLSFVVTIHEQQKAMSWMRNLVSTASAWRSRRW